MKQQVPAMLEVSRPKKGKELMRPPTHGQYHKVVEVLWYCRYTNSRDEFVAGTAANWRRVAKITTTPTLTLTLTT